ncbi:MAG TPA: polysaccharide biosynthesis/export family protein [Candidatus Binataceae bacterium]|nr:polysaccharide biosynthesis/export family protein [Candidatus Binataceae bacterium]
MARLILPLFLLFAAVESLICRTANGQSALRDESSYLPPAADVASSISDCRTSSEFRQLWNSRSSQISQTDYPIGPGDLLRITVVGVDQLEKLEVRVSGDSTIAFPFAGTVSVTHMTDDDLERELERRLSKYIRNPEVSVFNEEDKSRTVRVMGLVNKPGLIVLSSQNETIMDTIAEAGGLRDDASQRVLFIPGSAWRPGLRIGGLSASSTYSIKASPETSGRSVKGDTPIHSDSSDGELLAPASHTDGVPSPIVMNMHDDNERRCLELPARPGDTVIVPVAGNVTVEGWVNTPGAVNLTPGMTVLGAIAAAGGALFSSNARILRSGSGNQRAKLSVNLSAIRSGASPDIPLEAGDVVIVDRSVVGAVPYAVYSILGRFSPGLAIPIP